MRYSLQTIKPKKATVQGRPEMSQLIRELRQLTALTQEQFAALLGVAYGTLNRWENGHMQPSPLALKQIRAVLSEINRSPKTNLQARSQQLLDQYFPTVKSSG